jgi:hypothetical protein
MSTDLLFGVALVVLGSYSIYARMSARHHFGKLEPMKRVWGERGGLVVHVVAYTILPLLAGALLVFNALAE